MWFVIFSLALITLKIHGSEAVLNPACGRMPSKPSCTYDKSKVTDTMPICVLPLDQFGKCRGVIGMKNNSKPIVPPWFDYNFARRGQEITSEYRLPWYYNMFNGLLVEMIMPDILHPLLFNKKNIDGESNAKRDLATIMQGLVWTKDYLLKMPEEGHSNWIQSVKSVRNTHKSVQRRGYEKLEKDGCLINPKDYANIDTDDDVWDAFEADMAASDLLRGEREIPPISSWPSCPDPTTCSDCGSSCSSNCDESCSSDSPMEIVNPFGQFQIDTMSLKNAVMSKATLENGSTLEDVTFQSVFFAGRGLWINGTTADGKVYKSGEMEDGVITEAEIVKGKYRNRVRITGGTLTNGICADGMLTSGLVSNATFCQVKDRTCSTCSNCRECAWKAPNCYTANPSSFHCEYCICNDLGKKCTNCTGCTNFERCLNFTIPLYNQQALGFVIYNLVGFAVLWPKEIGISACDADLWAFNHLWAGILHGLGVDDECNLLLLPDIGSARVFYQGLFDSYILPTLFKFDKQTRFMMDNVFKGLKLLTGKTFTPNLLLCRFLRDFIKVSAKKSCSTMGPKEIMFDGIVNGMMMPQFMNDSTYRALLNKAMDDKFSANAQEYFPNGECENFERISKDCFV